MCLVYRVGHNLKWVPLSSKQGPYWHQVARQDERGPYLYKAWRKSRVKTSEGLLLDLTRFL